MSDLKPGALCVIVAGCPENIGMIVEVGSPDIVETEELDVPKREEVPA